MTAEEIVEHLKDQYLEVRILPDWSVAALCELFTTRSICLGCDEYSYQRWFCFSDRQLATNLFWQLKTERDIPAGYVARRPEWEDRADPYLNKLHDRPWNKEFE